MRTAASGVVIDLFREHITNNPLQTATVGVQTSGAASTSIATWSNTSGLYTSCPVVLTGGTASEQVVVVTISGSTVVVMKVTAAGVVGGPALYTDHTGATWGYGVTPDAFLEAAVSTVTPTQPTRGLSNPYAQQMVYRNWYAQLRKEGIQG